MWRLQSARRPALSTGSAWRAVLLASGTHVPIGCFMGNTAAQVVRFRSNWLCCGLNTSGLAVARAFGVSAYKASPALPVESQLIVATPSLVSHCIDRARDQFLLLASDGVWDVMSSEEVDAFVRHELMLANKQVLRILASGTL